MGAGRAAELGGAMSVIGEPRPPEPHAYLHLLGVHPGARVRASGEVLERGLAAAWTEGLVACLDTMNPDNVPFYEAHEMAVRHRIQLGAGGPAVWAMATSSTWPARAGK